MPRLINQLTPNPRLQRTRVRPLGGRSPLSRKSLAGRALKGVRMKRRQWFWFLALAGAALGLAVGWAPAAKRARPPTVKDLAGSWIGYTEDTLHAFRLDLELDGSGRCAYTFIGQPPSLFTIKNWTLKGTKIRVELESAAGDREGLEMKGHSAVDELRLTVIGVPSRSWKRDLMLHRQWKLNRDFELLDRALGPVLGDAG